jgi:hypothetical protein
MSTMTMLTKWVSLSIVVLVLFGFTSTALAQEPVVPTHSDPAWRAQYWNNTSLSGAAVLERQEPELSHNWGAGSPHPSIAADRFSARWARTIYTTAGTYRFTATSDDGIRVWLDDERIIDQWNDHAVTTFGAERALMEGHHRIVVEYYENQGLAVAGLTWAAVAAPSNAWRGEYWNNTTLSGNPALVRPDPQAHFDWGALSPAPGVVSADYFSARWTRTLDLPRGGYRFSVTVDDGARLWVNDTLLVDAWRQQAATTYAREIDLPGGPVAITLEYVEFAGHAVAQLAWEPAAPIVHNWRGEYFNNSDLSGSPALVRDDPHIAFDWGYGSPAGNIAADRFSVRWTQTLDFQPGHYRFAVTADDGVRLWINHILVVDAWRDQAATTYSADIDLTGGPVPIKMEYYENTRLAVAELRWELVSSPMVAGTVVVDDTDSGFSKGGSVTGWRTANAGHGLHLHWTKNNDWLRPYYNWARWNPSPQLQAGRYEVFAFIPDQYATTTEARYNVAHSGGVTTRAVDQSANRGRWVSLGTYWFNGAGSEHVTLMDATGETRLSRLIAFDAIKWEPR